MRKIAFMIAAAAMAAASSSAIAAQANDGFQVKVQINKRCSVTMPDIDFGALDSVAGTETATGTAKISCSKGATYSLGLTAATGAVTDPVTGAVTDPLVTSQGGSMTGATGSDTIPYSLAITAGATGTGAGLGVPQEQSATLSAALTAANAALTPTTYTDNRTLYINY